jgi:AcrR family transcriptional regulator
VDKQELICDEMSQKILDTAEELVKDYGRTGLTVRRILQRLGITNRVFYNRFHNVEEVMEILYVNTIVRIRESISCGIDPNADFFEQVIEIVAKTLDASYDYKKKFNDYCFQSDSLSTSNFQWWKNEIKGMIEYGIGRGLLKPVDAEGLSYAVWCFCRGYNADAVSRNLPKEEAIENFKYCFGIFLDGMKKE